MIKECNVRERMTANTLLQHWAFSSLFKCNKQHIEVDNVENNFRKSNLKNVTRWHNLLHMKNKKQFQLYIFKKDSDVSLLELLQILL